MNLKKYNKVQDNSPKTIGEVLREKGIIDADNKLNVEAFKELLDKPISAITETTINLSDSLNRDTLVEEVIDADFPVIKREIDEKGSCFKTAKKIASLIGDTRGGAKQFMEELKKSNIRGISYKKGNKDDYQGIRGTVVYGAEDTTHINDSKSEDVFEDVEEYKEHKGVYLTESIKYGDVVVSAEDIADTIGDIYDDDDVREEVMNNFARAGVRKVRFYQNNDSVDWECI